MCYISADWQFVKLVDNFDRIRIFYVLANFGPNNFGTLKLSVCNDCRLIRLSE